MNSNQQERAEQLKEAMRLLPYPVTIITTASGDKKRGITIGSFTSLSMEPPLVSFNVGLPSQIHELLEDAGQFVVHLPGLGQQDLCMRFSIPDQSNAEQFQGLDYDQENNRPPVLHNMIAEIYCTLLQRVEAGDHSIFIGEVQKVIKNRDEAAILYCDGEYRLLDRQ